MPLFSRNDNLQVRSPRDPDAGIPFTGYRTFEHTDTHSEREEVGWRDRQTDKGRHRSTHVHASSSEMKR